MPRLLLVLPSSTYRAADFVRAASTLGASVVVATDGEPPLLAERGLRVDLDDPLAAAEAMVGKDDSLPVDAVIAVDDRGVLPAAHAAARLGLPHNPPSAVEATRDKRRMRELLAAAEVSQPAFEVLPPGDEPTLPFPLVLKPLDRSGSVGVIRVDDADGARDASEWIRRIVDDPAAILLAERFVPGVEVSVEGLLRAGELEVLAVFDKPDPLDGPYFEETIYVTPSANASDELARTVSDGCRALGLVEGPVHAEARIGGDGVPVLIEVAARSIGGLCSRSLTFGAGVSLEELLLRHALGLPTTDLVRADGASGVLMIPIPRSGTLHGVGGRDAAAAVPGVVGVEITIPPEREVRALPEGDRYLGFVFATGATPDDVVASLRSAHACLDIDITS
ncbi:MAG TPA: ATP-grasp domain-containing protein [Acidimicrobiales bacterium]|nr:ATP-grasp domain-containing protein [Acidimicrobiales bacterium]